MPILFLFNLYNGISRESVLPLGTYLPDPKMVDTGEIALGVVVAGMAGLLLFRARTYRRGVPVTADAWGIQWRPRRGRTISLAWHDVRSFFTFSYGFAIGSGSAGQKTLVYAVDAGDALLVCQCYPALSDVPAAVRQRTEVDRFVKLVIARTGKPLRNFPAMRAGLRNALARLLTMGCCHRLRNMSSTQPLYPAERRRGRHERMLPVDVP